MMTNNNDSTLPNNGSGASVSDDAINQALDSIANEGQDPTNQDSPDNPVTTEETPAGEQEIKEMSKEEVDSLSLGEINSLLGKNFQDKDTALKSIKDTFSYVGKKVEGVADDLKDKGYMTKEQFENELFFRDNPEHAANKSILEAIAKDKGISTPEAAKDESYMKLFEGASNYEKTQSKKSVLESNPRLANIENKAKTVSDLAKAGSKEAAAAEAANAVIEAFGL